MFVQALLVAVVMFVIKFFDWAFNLNISRPIVIAPLVGLVLGNVSDGILIGAALELVFLGSITIGGSVPQEVSIGATFGAAYAILLNESYEVAITLAVPISILGAFFYNTLKLVFTALVEKLDNYLDMQNEKAFNIVFMSQIFIFALSYAAIIFIGIILGTDSVQAIVSAIPEKVMKGLTVAAGILPALGFGLLLKMLWEKSIALFFFLGFAMSAYGKLPTMGVAVFATCIAVYVCYTDFASKKKVTEIATTQTIEVSDEEDFFNE